MDKNKELKNIFLNEKSGQSSKITFAKTGKIEIIGDKKLLILEDGVTINETGGQISEFKFSKTDFNISRFSTKTTITKKIQETSTKVLVNCLYIFHKTIDNTNISKIKLDRNCGVNNLVNIHQELYSRLIKPLYITFLICISLLFILVTKNSHSFNTNKIKIYSLGFISIIFLEVSSKFISLNLIQNLILIFLPIIFVLIVYLFFLKFLKTN